MVAAIRSGKDDEVEWLDEANLAGRLETLRKDHAAWRLPSDTGQFSLAGAQPKTALLFHGGRWGIPSGRLPTTHILKPPTGQFGGHAENEHLCLMLARGLGLPAAQIERHAVQEGSRDRRRALRPPAPKGNDIIRVHQEDACQALRVPRQGNTRTIAARAPSTSSSSC